MTLRTDLAIAQLPSSAPNVGGLYGKNTIYIDPVFGSKIVRLTDASSGNGLNFDSMQSDDDPSGYAMWNTDDTLILVRSTGGSAFLNQFNPTTMQGAQLGGANPSYPYKLSGANTPSHVNNGLVLNCPANGTVVNALTYVLVDGVWTYQSTAVFCDFKNILPGGSEFKVTWQSELEVSSGDIVATLAFSDTGNQNTGIYVCIYKPGSGYRMLNTQTLAITGQWGAIGTATLENTPATSFFVHGVNQPPNPLFTCIGPKTLDDTFIWANETLSIVSTGLGGHHGIGYVNLYTGNPGGGQYDAVPFSNPSTHSEIIPKQAGPPGLPSYNVQYPGGPAQVYTGDQHSAMGPLNTLDETILWITNGAPPISPFTSCWMGELRGIDVTGAISGAKGTVYRLCHTYNSGKSTQYIVANALASPSQTGRFIAYGSDMGGAGTVGPLGSTSGAPTGIIGENARGDVFIAAANLTPLISVSTSALPGGTVGSPYSTTLKATGGLTPYTWSITAGSLPSALSLNPATGVISGTLNASGSFTVTATDSTIPTPQTASANLSITASSSELPLEVTSSGSLPGGTVGSAYPGATLQATGGTSPYIWSLTSGALPAGLVLNPSTGAISGTPTAAGTANFTLTVTDSETPTPQTASSSFSIVVTMIVALGVTTSALPAAPTGSAYSQALQATGGIAPYTWAITVGSLPSGLSLNASTGVISGTLGSSSAFTVTATDSESSPQTASAALSIGLLKPGTMYDVIEIDNPGEAHHHLEIWCQVLLD